MNLQHRRGDLTVAATKSATWSDARGIETSIPFWLDALRWSGFHTLAALALSGTLKESPSLHFSNIDV